MQLDEATKEKGDVIISSPGFMPAAIMAKCKPAVPLETAQAYLVPTFSAKLFSNALYCGPKLKFPEFKTFSTPRFSSRPKYGLAMGYVFIGVLAKLNISKFRHR